VNMSWHNSSLCQHADTDLKAMFKNDEVPSIFINERFKTSSFMKKYKREFF
jgi:hypothetical protein